MKVLLIEEHDYVNKLDTIIGVASTIGHANVMISDFYHKRIVKTVHETFDIPNSNIKEIRGVKVRVGAGVRKHREFSIVLEWFEIDKIGAKLKMAKLPWE